MKKPSTSRLAGSSKLHKQTLERVLGRLVIVGSNGDDCSASVASLMRYFTLGARLLALDNCGNFGYKLNLLDSANVHAFEADQVWRRPNSLEAGANRKSLSTASGGAVTISATLP